MNPEITNINPRGHPKSKKKNFVLTGIFVFCFALVSFSQTSLLEIELTLPAQDTTVNEFLKVLGNNAGCTFTHGDEIPLTKKVIMCEYRILNG